jgi:hypothetical protein
MIASRIEGGINPFINYLRRTGVKSDILVLVVFNKYRAATRYLKRRDFLGDYNLVTDTTILNLFSFSAGILEVPFVTKFCLSAGELLSSYALLGAVDSAVVNWFIADHSKPKVKKSLVKRPQPVPLKDRFYKPIIGKRIKLHDTDEFPLSTTDYISVNPSGSNLSLKDNLTQFIYIFDLNTGRLVNVLFPDSTEEMMFINIPSGLYHFMKRNNIINSMYFSPAFCDDTTLLLTASLPEIEMKVTELDTNVTYHNAAVLIKKDIFTNIPMSVVRFLPFSETCKGSFSHTNVSFVTNHNLVFLPFSKGWPVGAEMLNEKTPVVENPFADEFYERDLHQFAVYNLDGEFIRFWGRLSERMQRLRLGYVASGGLVRFYDGKYYLSDGWSGKIYSYNQDATLIDSILVFDESAPLILAVNQNKEPLRYLIETFKANFPKRVVDFLVNRDYCYVLLLDQNQPFVYQISLNDQSTRRFILPLRLESKQVKYYLLREVKAGVATVSLLDSSEETYYCEFLISDHP